MAQSLGAFQEDFRRSQGVPVAYNHFWERSRGFKGLYEHSGCFRGVPYGFMGDLWDFRDVSGYSSGISRGSVAFQRASELLNKV